MSENPAGEQPVQPDDEMPKPQADAADESAAQPEPSLPDTAADDATAAAPASDETPAAGPVSVRDAQLPRAELSLAAQVEGLLFVASEAVAPAQLAEALEVGASSVEVALKELETSLKPRGLRLQRQAGRVQLTTAPELAPAIENFLGLDATSRLSRAALETLAIIAYQQPITHPQIDAIRGVNSDSMLKSLLGKGLIYEAGRAEGPGRPILYVTAPAFLQHLGLNSIAELPALELAEEKNISDELLKG